MDYQAIFTNQREALTQFFENPDKLAVLVDATPEMISAIYSAVMVIIPHLKRTLPKLYQNLVNNYKYLVRNVIEAEEYVMRKAFLIVAEIQSGGAFLSLIMKGYETLGRDDPHHPESLVKSFNEPPKQPENSVAADLEMPPLKSAIAGGKADQRGPCGKKLSRCKCNGSVF